MDTPHFHMPYSRYHLKLQMVDHHIISTTSAAWKRTPRQCRCLLLHTYLRKSTTASESSILIHVFLHGFEDGLSLGVQSLSGSALSSDSAETFDLQGSSCL